MKLGLFAALILVAACSPPQTSRPSDNRTAGTPPTSESRTTPNTVNRDAYECEREAALSGAGGKAEAFNRCMRARGHGSKQ